MGKEYKIMLDPIPHFNPENIFVIKDKFIYINEEGYEFDVTNMPVHWKCSDCGHGWKESIKLRTEGHGCPECK